MFFQVWENNPNNVIEMSSGLSQLSTEDWTFWTESPHVDVQDLYQKGLTKSWIHREYLCPWCIKFNHYYLNLSLTGPPALLNCNTKSVKCPLMIMYFKNLNSDSKAEHPAVKPEKSRPPCLCCKDWKCGITSLKRAGSLHQLIWHKSLLKAHMCKISWIIASLIFLFDDMFLFFLFLFLFCPNK